MSLKPNKIGRHYFDYNATSPIAEGVAEAVLAALQLPGNPSSLHAEGRAAQALLERSRRNVASCVGADSHDLIFTSGGTEANHLGVVGLARAAGKSGAIIAPATVHPSLWAASQRAGEITAGFAEVSVQEGGSIDLDRLEEQLASGAVSLLTVSLANHEVGTLENMERLSNLCRSHGALLHCDAVQALGRLDLGSLTTLVDSVALSAHKVGGPKGVGALWLRPGPPVESLIGGGKQESGRRPGTQAVALAAGFAVAAGQVDERIADASRQAKLRDRLQCVLAEQGAVVLSTSRGLCNTLLLRFAGVPGELLVAALDLSGFAVSTGAACSSGTVEASPGLLAMGLDHREAMEALRISLGPGTRSEDVDALIGVMPEILARARRFG